MKKINIPKKSAISVSELLWTLCKILAKEGSPCQVLSDFDERACDSNDSGVFCGSLDCSDEQCWYTYLTRKLNEALNQRKEQ